MKSRIACILCIGTLVITAAGCADNADQAESNAQTEEPVTGFPFDTQLAEIPKERFELSENKFCEMATEKYNVSEKEAKAMYRKITDSNILETENMRLTGAVLNDYDANGKTDMIVCLYEDKEDADSYTDGCLYLFMNEDENPYYIYDDFCCYSFGSIFGDFGADIDGDGNTEIVFCVQGTGCGGAGDCQKFMVKYKDKAIERMDLPTDFTEEDNDYDIGLSVDVERDNENNVYRISCPDLDDTILMGIPKDDEDWGGGANCRGYYMLSLEERDGKQVLAGYEYLYAGAIADGIGNAVFLFDWDENGEIYVSDWYIEDWDGKVYVSYDRIQKNESNTDALFGSDETDEEIKAYEDFLAGKCTADVAYNAHIEVSYIGGFLKDSAAGSEEEGFSVRDLITKISEEIVEMRGDGSIGRMEYALIDCGGDGKKQLALRAYGLGIYSAEDDSDLTMVFDERDGNVTMIYAADSWARSENELYGNGYVFGGGSGGASSHYVWEGIIDADGVYHKTYDCHTETGQGLYGMSSCWEVWDSSDNEGFPAEFCEYEIKGDIIYSYSILDDVTDAERKIVTDYIKDNEARMGIRFLTSSEAWARVEKNREACGITEGIDAEENRIVWKTFSVTE